MTFEEFQKPMSRLVAQFGANNYSAERIKIFYRELAGTDLRLWERTVDTLLGESRFAPMLADIRECIAKAREQGYLVEKVKNSREAEAAYRALTADEAGFIFGNIKKRITGELPDQDFDAFLKVAKDLKNGSAS